MKLEFRDNHDRERIASKQQQKMHHPCKEKTKIVM